MNVTPGVLFYRDCRMPNLFITVHGINRVYCYLEVVLVEQEKLPSVILQVDTTNGAERGVTRSQTKQTPAGRAWQQEPQNIPPVRHTKSTHSSQWPEAIVDKTDTLCRQ